MGYLFDKIKQDTPSGGDNNWEQVVRDHYMTKRNQLAQNAVGLTLNAFAGICPNQRKKGMIYKKRDVLLESLKNQQTLHAESLMVLVKSDMETYFDPAKADITKEVATERLINSITDICNTHSTQLEAYLDSIFHIQKHYMNTRKLALGFIKYPKKDFSESMRTALTQQSGTDQIPKAWEIASDALKIILEDALTQFKFCFNTAVRILFESNISVEEKRLKFFSLNALREKFPNLMLTKMRQVINVPPFVSEAVQYGDTVWKDVHGERIRRILQEYNLVIRVTYEEALKVFAEIRSAANPKTA